jgi:hypothetical protein
VTTTASNAAKRFKNSVERQAKHAAANPWFERLERFGFVVRGLIYIIIGVLALQLAAGAGGAATNPTSAIALIGRQPQGQLLLALVAAGLAGYSLWGFVRAILDPLGRGSDAKGLLVRAGFLFSGVSYGLLLIPTVLTLLDKPAATATGGATGVPTSLTSGPLGKWLIVGFGLFWVALGASQVAAAYRAHFTRDLKTVTMSAKEVRLATWLGRIGFAARGVVFGLVGVIILQTVFAPGAKQPPGFDGALTALVRAPYGQALLAAVAIGLILFGVYSALCAKWNKIGGGQKA